MYEKKNSQEVQDLQGKSKTKRNITEKTTFVKGDSNEQRKFSRQTDKESG